MGMFSVYAVLALLAAPTADVQVKLLRGEELQGRLVAASVEKLTIATSGGEQTIPAPEVLSVEFPQAANEAERGRVWIELLDGSQLIAGDISLGGGKATVELLGGEKLTDFPARAIRAIRLQKPDDSRLTAAWNEILEGTRGGDLLVLRKSATREVEENGQVKTISTLTLDELEGAVLGIGPESVKFDFDGDKVDVKREKLEGVVLFQPVKRDLPAASLRMTDIAGSEWRLRTLDLKDEQLVATTPAGVSLQVPLAHVRRLDFSAGNVAMLAQLPMEASEASSALLPKGLSPAALEWFGPSAGKRPGLNGQSAVSSSTTVGLTGASSVTYRVPEGFRWFRAGLLLAGKAGSGSDVEVVILGDGKPLARHPLSATGDRKPLQVEVDVSGVRRLSLQAVSPAQGLGALVDFQDARFTK